MSDVNAMARGIATNLATIPGLRTYSTIPDDVNVPCAIVSLTSVDYDQAFQGGLTNYQFNVTVIVSRITERRAQERVNAYIATGAGGVKAAIESDRTLDGAAFDCVVTEMTNITSANIGEVEYLTAEFNVVVRAN